MAAKVVKWPKIMLYGDSITQFCMGAEGCWGALVADHFQRRADIVVRGFSGYNTRNSLALLPHVARDLQGFAGATVFLGANDASLPHSPQAVPVGEYAQNLKGIVGHFRAAGVAPLLITPPALDGAAWAQYCSDNGKVFAKDEGLTGEYARVCCEVAGQLGVPVLDLHSAMHAQANWRSMLCDGLHLSRPGAEFLASLLTPSLDSLLPPSVPSPLLLPPWSDLDPDNSTKNFEDWCKENVK